MMDINLIKNAAIILDFLVSMFAAMMQGSNPGLSGMLFGLSAVILLVAVICVIVEVIQNRN